MEFRGSAIPDEGTSDSPFKFIDPLGKKRESILQGIDTFFDLFNALKEPVDIGHGKIKTVIHFLGQQCSTPQVSSA